jgi:hypothetical protein
MYYSVDALWEEKEFSETETIPWITWRIWSWCSGSGLPGTVWYAAMLVNFRLPEGLGQTLLCIVTVFFNKLFMIYSRKCNWAITCKCTGYYSVDALWEEKEFSETETIPWITWRIWSWCSGSGLPGTSAAIFFYRKLIVRLVVSISPTLKWVWGQS